METIKEIIIGEQKPGALPGHWPLTRIQLNGGKIFGGHIFIDGHKIGRVRSIAFKAGVDICNSMEIEFISGIDAEIELAKIQFGIDMPGIKPPEPWPEIKPGRNILIEDLENNIRQMERLATETKHAAGLARGDGEIERAAKLQGEAEALKIAIEDLKAVIARHKNPAKSKKD